MTTYTKIVDPNNGPGTDYTSLSAWEAGEQTLYNSGDIAIADCRRTGSTKDTTHVKISGWTTGVIPKIVVHSDYRHEGKIADQRADGNYIYWVRVTYYFSDRTIVSATIPDCEFIGLAVEQAQTGNYDANCVANNRGTTRDCLLVYNYQYTSNFTKYGLNLEASPGYVNRAYNNIIVNISGTKGTTRGITGNYGTSYIYNNTIKGFDKGIACSSSSHLKNNISVDCNTDFNSSPTNSASNVSSDATAPGSGSVTGKTAYTDYFVDPDTDLHLKDTANNLFGITGTDLSGTFTDDIDGDTRSVWDVGADEYTQGGVLPILLNAAQPTRVIQ